MNAIAPRRTLALSLLASSLGIAACTPGDDDMKEAPTDPNVPATRESSVAAGVIVESELSTVTKVQGWTTDASGNLMLDVGSEAVVDSDGFFTMDVRADESLYVVEALDSNGSVVGMAVLEATAEADGTATVTPIDKESSIEAATWLSLAAESASTTAWSYPDVRERVGAELAASVHGSWVADGGSSADVRLIADSIAVAQQAEALAWADAGATVDHDAMMEAEHAASAELSAELFAAISSGASSTDDAHMAQESFAADLRAATEVATGLEVHHLSEASTTSWMAQSAVVEASAGSESALTKGVKIAWGEGQAVRSDEVVVAMIAELNASAQSDAEAAGDTLEGDAWSATDVSAMASAWSSYGDTIVGDGSGSSLLGTVLGLDIGAELAYGALSEACLDGMAGLYTDLVVEAQGRTGSDMSDAEAATMAAAVVSARSDFRGDLVTAANGLDTWLTTGTMLDATVFTMLAADGSFVGSTDR